MRTPRNLAVFAGESVFEFPCLRALKNLNLTMIYLKIMDSKRKYLLCILTFSLANTLYAQLKPRANFKNQTSTNINMHTVSVIDKTVNVALGEQKVFELLSMTAGKYIFETGGKGDVDLYLSYDRAPTTKQYLTRSFNDSTDEQLVVDLPATRNIYLMLHGSTISTVHLTGKKIQHQSAPVIPTVMSDTLMNTSGTLRRGETKFFETRILPAGAYDFQLTGTGDVDLYVNRGRAPTLSLYDCRPYKSDSAESCSVVLSVPSDIYIMIVGTAQESTYELIARKKY